uniref:HipA N-terminal domain-containing protein n=1 Tax=Erwinia sp. E_sp_W01_6 TaxID=3039408 RepID=UPI00403F0F1F
MRRCLNVWLYGECIGQLSQDNEGYLFDYCQGYRGPALSLSLPINGGPFRRPVLHPYFASLAPEGWLKSVIVGCKNWMSRICLACYCKMGKTCWVRCN